jgi:LytS/YehU family sensor histidine kinase
MNHHFTFNVLNSIQYYVVKNDLESVEYYLEKFSSLIRMILDQSRKPYVSLDVELKMINLYIELEEMRFEKQFDYSIEVSNKIIPEEIMIPGMLIQPVIENAIKHGIEHKVGEAMVTIVFDIIDSTLVCRVHDNGIGRSESELHKFNPNKTSAGSNILKERLKALSFIFKIKLNHTIKDLVSDDGKPTGTLVTLQIPYIQL